MSAANTEDWERIETLFQTAAELPAASRSGFLDQACAGDVELREELESLLAADNHNASAIDSAVQKEARSLFGIEEMTGTRVGPYRVIRECPAVKIRQRSGGASVPEPVTGTAVYPEGANA